TRNAQRVRSYLVNLEREIDMQSALFDDSRLVQQLHLGGGTPNYLNHKQIWALMADLRQAFRLDESDSREFSVEIDPRCIERNSIEVLADLGFNRISIGVQDFDPRVQESVNRMQSIELICKVVEDARENQFRSVSFDLIYGLPHQTVESFDRTLETVLAIRPERLAIYNYAHLPARFKAQRMITEKYLPSPQSKLQILQHTIEKLGDSDYVYIGMDHFALPGDDLVTAKNNGTLQRNFQGYSTHGGCDLIGLGTSAIGHIGNAYSQNAVSTADYEYTLATGTLPIVRGIEIDDDDQLRAEVIQSLMCHDGLSIDEFELAHRIDFQDYFRDELARLEPLANDGLIHIDDDGIQITGRGRLLMRSIAMVFDRHLNEARQNYSKAI
ncbi:MAG: oxygen-independent coproporphyrinogen III oxidase, partial [Woeseiaceae bacterium]|nr:oxygen-independent coproporphyrinogen III oxidase [Woeseiaceae bacterium]